MAEVVNLPVGLPGAPGGTPLGGFGLPGNPGGFPLGGLGSLDDSLSRTGGTRTSGGKRGARLIGGGMTSAKIDGIPLLGSQPVRWSIREGVQPVVESFHIAAQDLQAFSRKARVSLELVCPRGSITFQNLWLVNTGPGPNPYISTITVADRRIWWSYTHVLRRFNMRRRVGVKRPVSPTAELQPVLPDVQYAKYSLKDPESGKKWAAVDALESVLRDVIKADPEKDETYVLPKLGGLDVENLEIDDAGDAALARILSYFPGWTVYVASDGSIQFYSRGDATDETAVARMRPPIVGMGNAGPVQRRPVRPKEVHVLFTPEVEVRFDYTESASTQTTKTEKQKEDQRLLDNVLSVPDFTLFVGNNQVTQGTWITLDDALASWPVNFLRSKRITKGDLLRAFVPFKDLWGGFVLGGQKGDNARFDWAARVGALQTHWRRSFRLPQRWMDRTLSIRAYRVATVDPVTGSRAPATAYMDYIMVPGQRAFFGMGQTDRANAVAAINVPGYQATIGPTSKPSPVEVSVIDHDQGILRLEILSDPARMFTQFIPGTISDTLIPTGDIAIAGRQGQTVAWNGAPGGNWVSLDASWKMSVILTLIPAGPNSQDQLYRVVVKPEDVRDIVPPFALGQAGNGPVMTVRIPASVETARVRWADDDAQTIARIFGVGREGKDSDEQIDISRMVVNKFTSTRAAGPGQTTTGGTVAAGLENIARAEAARIWTEYADRHHGTIGTDLAALGDLSLGGNLEELLFEIAPDGRATIQGIMPAGGLQMSLFAFMDPGTRSLVLHLVKGDD